MIYRDDLRPWLRSKPDWFILSIEVILFLFFFTAGLPILFAIAAFSEYTLKQIVRDLFSEFKKTLKYGVQ